MATGKVARRTAVVDVAALLDSPEVEALIAAIEAVGDKRGRKGFGTRALVGACLVKSLFALPTWTWVAALIAEHPGLQEKLGASPSVWACYRFARKLRENHPVLADCIDSVAAALREQYPDFGKDIAIDASDLPAWANGQRYVSQNGPERERFPRSGCELGASQRRQHPQGWRLLRIQAQPCGLHRDGIAACVASHDGSPS